MAFYGVAKPQFRLLTKVAGPVQEMLGWLPAATGLPASEMSGLFPDSKRSRVRGGRINQEPPRALLALDG